MDSTTERLLREAGISADLWNMGAASVAYTEGCHGVARTELERLIALVRADERPTQPLHPTIGDYVLATKWSDGDPGDPWAVGFYAGEDHTTSQTRYMVNDAKGETIRRNGYRRVGRITHEIGRWLMENGDNLERAPSKINLWTMYDWEYVNDRVLAAAIRSGGE